MEVGIKQLEYYYALDLELYRHVHDVHDDVYGTHSGGKSELIMEFEGILVSDDFFSSDGAYSGNLEEGFLYTSSNEPKVGDIIKVISQDNKIRRFKINGYESLGTQTEVISRYKLSNIGD